MDNNTFTIHSDTRVSDNTHIQFDLTNPVRILTNTFILLFSFSIIFLFYKSFRRKEFLGTVQILFSDLKIGICNFFTEPNNFSTERVICQALIFLPMLYTSIFSDFSLYFPFLIHLMIIRRYFFAIDTGYNMDYGICKNSTISTYLTFVVNTIVSIFIMYYVKPPLFEFSFYWNVLIFILLLLESSKVMGNYCSIKILKFCEVIILLHFRLDIISFVIFIALEAFIVSEYINLTEIMEVKRMATQKIIYGFDEDTLNKMLEQKKDEYNKNIKIEQERLEKLEADKKVEEKKAETERLAKLDADKKVAEKKAETERLAKLDADKKVAEKKAETERLAKLNADKKAVEQKEERERLQKIEFNKMVAEQNEDRERFNQLMLVKMLGIKSNTEIWKERKKKHFFDFTKYVPDRYDYICVEVDKIVLWETQRLYQKIDGKYHFVKYLKVLKGADWYDGEGCKINLVKEKYFVKVLDIHS